MQPNQNCPQTIWGYWSISLDKKNYMRAFRVLMVIYFSFLYNVNSLGISRRYWRISSSSFEVKQYLPPPSASPREVGRYCITSQDSEDILQYLLKMPRLLSHCSEEDIANQEWQDRPVFQPRKFCLQAYEWAQSCYCVLRSQSICFQAYRCPIMLFLPFWCSANCMLNNDKLTIVSIGWHTLFPGSDFHPVLYLPKPSSLQIIPLSSYRPKLYFTQDFLPLNFFLILPLFNTPEIFYSGYINFHWFNYPRQVSSFDLKFPVGYLAKI